MIEQLRFNDKSKAELLQFLQAYQHAIDASIICSITNTEGIIIYANQKFCESSKYTREELLGQNHRILNAGYHPDIFFKEMWETISSGQMWRNEVKSRAKDGSYFWQDSLILPVFDGHRQITQYFSLRIPIDDRKKAEEDREQRIKELETLVFKISHELRQPVTQILGITHLLADDSPAQQDLTTFVTALHHSAEQLDQYTKEITVALTAMRNSENGKA